MSSVLPPGAGFGHPPLPLIQMNPLGSAVMPCSRSGQSNPAP